MRLLTWVLSAVIVLALAAAPASADVNFTLNPSNGVLRGEAGQTLGWGLTIQNLTPEYLVITGVTYDQTQSIGVFTDFLTPQFSGYDLGPGLTWKQPFDPTTTPPQGLGSYVIDGSFASLGDMAVGNLDVLYDLHTIDPNAADYDPGNDTVTGGQSLPLPATVTYTPEPATIGMDVICLAALVLAITVRRRRLLNR